MLRNILNVFMKHIHVSSTNNAKQTKEQKKTETKKSLYSSILFLYVM